MQNFDWTRPKRKPTVAVCALASLYGFAVQGNGTCHKKANLAPADWLWKER